ncbi:MAG: SIMPL domain-containing protein [Pseudohongiella sp.]|nr:SIMPL domain-containing protein [Pseudohongiella sp.]
MRQATRLLTSTSLICSMLLGLASGVASAQTPITLLPEGQTLITLTLTERTRVGQDTLTADLRIEVDDRDPAVVQNRINTVMAEALELTRNIDGVSVATGYYGIYQFNRNPAGNRADEMWRGSQNITLESRDSAKVLELAGQLQAKGFLMNQLSYSLSTEQADEVRDSLMEAALVRAQQKAERAARALGKSNVELASVDIDSQSGGYYPPVMMRSMAADARTEMAAPVADAGETEVTLTVRVQAVAR